MKERPGCLKSCLFGCLGLIGLVFLFLAIAAGLAAINLKDSLPVDQALEQPVAAAPVFAANRPGRMILNVSQGELIIGPAASGAPLSVKVKFDDEVHDMEERFEVLPDSTWVYELSFFRTMGGMQALFRSIMGGGSDASVQVRIPPELPMGLELVLRQGGAEIELGGLLITDVDIDYSQGGLAMAIDEPLVEPMDSFVVNGKMGGFAVEGLGNASPRVLVVDSSMGGADVGLEGAWRQDCDVNLKIRMGGMGVRVPDGVVIEGATVSGERPLQQEGEVPLPVLRFTLSQSMGEIELY